MRFLVLYEELATYFLNCLNYMASHNDMKIVVYMKKINTIAPFNFDQIHDHIEIRERENYTDEEIDEAIKEFDPDFTYLSGWIYKPYLKLIKRNKLPNVIIGFDNHFVGSSKQRLGTVYFKLFLKPYIKAAFVPGEIQAKYARKLGFEERFISKNVYCCDHQLYSGFFDQTIASKKTAFPKRLLFVGRYVEEKGLRLLWECFSEIQYEKPNEWELWCIGKGPIEPIKHPKIKHLGFVQPNEFLPIIKDTGVFILPSYFEPWGVVVHEFASAGFPIICTDHVGAASTFVENGKNGFIIKGNSKTELKNAIKKIVSLSDAELTEMSEVSHKMSKRITPQIWQESVLKLVNG